MTIPLLRACVLLAGLSGLGATTMAVVSPIGRPEGPTENARAATATDHGPAQALDQQLLERAAQHPAFRADRRRSANAYDPTRAVTPDSQPAPPIPKPSLSVSGIVWGQEPAAVVEGLPGVEGQIVLRRGDSAAGFRVLRIDGERVVIRGMDTTWRLPVRDPWK
jgi:hypothetical protein